MESEDVGVAQSVKPVDSSVDLFNGVRASIKNVALRLNEIREDITPNTVRNNVENRGEVMANLALAYRHLEDASMRLGKAIQANDGGVSVYDKETVVGA